MKQYDLRIWRKRSFQQNGSDIPNKSTDVFVTIRIIPSTWQEEGCQNGFLFEDNNAYHIFVDSYEIVRDKSTTNWNDYFSIKMNEAKQLVVSSSTNSKLFCDFPELRLYVPE